MRNALYLFTTSFPYGTKSETFLETEIKVLAERFDTVYVVPAQRDGEHMRKLPANVLVKSWLLEGPPKNAKQLILKHGWLLLRVFLFMWRSSASNRRHYRQNFRYYLGKILGELDYYARLKPHLKGIDANTTTFYTYWFEYSLLALCFLKQEGNIKRLVSRAHRFDLYDDRNQGRPIPFREYKLHHLDALYCISAHGQNYVKQRVDKVYHPKINLSYLGVHAPKVIPDKPSDHIPLVVSVSSMVDFKRVGLIAEALKEFPSPMRWIHFGSGAMYDSVLQQIKDLPAHIHVELKGHVDNQTVLDFYNRQFVDLFLSTSESEGLPVSMMEAQSFGIPILSCNVGGIEEIVIDDKTGFLLPEKLTPEFLVNHLGKSLKVKFDRKTILAHFALNFEANRNYRLFCEKTLNNR